MMMLCPSSFTLVAPDEVGDGGPILFTLSCTCRMSCVSLATQLAVRARI